LEEDIVATNPYNKYSNNKVYTASKEELVLMLYDGALKFCNQAIIALENKDSDSNEVSKAHTAIVRVQNIVREFQVTLDRQYEISDQLDSIYDYLYRRLVEANLKKDKEIVAEVRDFLRDLRETWKEAMLVAKQEQ
jgi:flagellar protein FliS